MTSSRCRGGGALVVAAAAGALVGLAGQEPGTIEFVEQTASSGLDFLHQHGGTGERYMVETMGSGVALVDADVDGWLDAYFVQQGATPGYESTEPLTNRLFRNTGTGAFSDVSVAAGVDDDDGYGMGVAAADYDNDGFPDLYVTNFGPNVLLRNNGDGTFSRVIDSNTDDPLWGASTAWADIDRDGDLDLYVTNYVDFGWDNNVFCGDAARGVSAYCNPSVYNALPDRLYENLGDATFREIGESAGIAETLEGKGLGVVWGDYDDDGDLDAYIANDGTRNFLYTNQGDNTFVDDGFLAGVGFSEDGRTEAGMGTDFGDIDADGLLDLIVTNLTLETNTLYRNLGDGLFLDESFARGVGRTSLLYVGFGANWIDADNDRDLDLFIANGHIIDNIDQFQEEVEDSTLEDRTYPQPNHLYVNDGRGQFTESHANAGTGLAPIKVSRGSATGDVDNDGDIDIVVSNSNQAADYLRNDTQAANWILLTLVGTDSNRSAVGARITVLDLPGGEQLVREVKAGDSYASSSDRRLHIGLGAATAASLRIRWPNGATEELIGIDANSAYLVREGAGVLASRPADTTRAVSIRGRSPL